MDETGVDVDRKPVWSRYSYRQMMWARPRVSLLVADVSAALAVEHNPQVSVQGCLQTTGRVLVRVTGIKIIKSRGVRQPLYASGNVAFVAAEIDRALAYRPLSVSVHWHEALTAGDVLEALAERGRELDAGPIPSSHAFPKPESNPDLSVVRREHAAIRRHAADFTTPLAILADSAINAR